jgi:WD40 repeat protein
MTAGLADNSLRVWNVKGGSSVAGSTTQTNPSTPVKFIGHSDMITSASVSPDNKYVLSSSVDTSIRLWSMETKEAVAVFRGHNYPVWDCEWGPFGVYFCSGGYDRTARLWSSDRIDPLRVFCGHTSDVDVLLSLLLFRSSSFTQTTIILPLGAAINLFDYGTCRKPDVSEYSRDIPLVYAHSHSHPMEEWSRVAATMEAFASGISALGNYSKDSGLERE